MFQSKLRNQLKKNFTPPANRAYKKQRNQCVSLIRKAKNSFYRNLNPSFITDNKKLRKTVKPLFSNKTMISAQSITLYEQSQIYDNGEDVANIFNEFL